MKYQCAPRRKRVEVRKMEKEQAKEGTWDTNIYFILVSSFFLQVFFPCCSFSSVALLSVSSLERAGAASTVCGPVSVSSPARFYSASFFCWAQDRWIYRELDGRCLSSTYTIIILYEWTSDIFQHSSSASFR